LPTYPIKSAIFCASNAASNPSGINDRPVLVKLTKSCRNNFCGTPSIPSIVILFPASSITEPPAGGRSEDPSNPGPVAAVIGWGKKAISYQFPQGDFRVGKVD
jgi:hypothetical protein